MRNRILDKLEKCWPVLVIVVAIAIIAISVVALLANPDYMNGSQSLPLWLSVPLGLVPLSAVAIIISGVVIITS